MPDLSPPMPATWPRLDVPEYVIDRLRTLWRGACSDDERWHLEQLGVEIEKALREL
jgi:hypothetical protein